MINITTKSVYIKSPKAIFSAVIMVTILAIFYLLGDIIINQKEANIFLIANLLTSLPFFVYYYRTKYIFLFNPINFVFPSILLGTTLRGLYIYLGFGDNWYIDNTLLLGKDYTVLFAGSMINLVGAWLLLFGFLVTKNKKIVINGISKIFTSPIWSQRRFNITIALLVAISLGAFALYLKKINFSLEVISKKRYSVVQNGDEEVFSSFGYLTLFIKFGELALHLFAIWYYSMVKKFKWNLFILFTFLFLVAHIPNFVDSSRSAIIYSFTFIVITRLILKEGELKIQKMLPLIGIIIFIIIIMGSIREISNYEEDDASSKIAEDFGVVNILEKVVGNRNLMGVTKASHIYEVWNDEEYNYYGGYSLLIWIYSPIPRSIWPNKPQTSIGLDIKEIFGNSNATARGGVPPGFPTELFMNFGVFGIFLMIFYGIFLKSLYNFMRTYCNRNTLFLYFLILIHLAFGLIGNNFSKSIADLLIDSLPLILILVFIVVSQKKVQ
jgi:oligosaccharide repeat unit polymerase